MFKQSLSLFSLCVLFTAVAAEPQIDRAKAIQFDLLDREAFQKQARPFARPVQNSLPVSDRAEGVAARSLGPVPQILPPAGQSQGGKSAMDRWLELQGGVASRNFSNLAALSRNERTTGSAASTVKLFFKRANGNSYQCSGKLINPMVVLTAGHCVHGGPNPADGGWNTLTEVIPGWERGDFPYGNTFADYHVSWSGWTRSGDFNDDVGLVVLKYPIGMLAGWSGYGYNDDCNFFRTGTWNLWGYPAAPPYNGDIMYGAAGTFDRCDNIQTAQYYRQAYGGQSGSNAVFTESSGTYSYGVLSNGSVNATPPVTEVVRLNAAKFAYIQDTALPPIYPSGPELYLNLVSSDPAAPTNVKPGETLNLEFLEFNNGLAPYVGAYEVKVLLSQDPLGSSAQEIGSFAINAGRTGTQPHDGVWRRFPYTLPADLQVKGDYFLQLMVVHRNDPNTANNLANGPLLSIRGPGPVISSGILAPTRGATGTPIVMSVAATDGDNNITGYSWNFGDGKTASTSEAVQSYNAPGIYTVSVTVRDADGNQASATHQIEIFEKGLMPFPPGAPIGPLGEGTNGWGFVATPMSKPAGKLKALLSKSGRDTISLKGSLPPGVSGKGASVYLYLLGVELTATTNAKGTTSSLGGAYKGSLKTKYSAKTGATTFTLTATGDFAARWNKFGGMSRSSSPLTLVMSINGQIFHVPGVTVYFSSKNTTTTGSF